jgi:ParB-like chromosome segregation protein Spo0J
MRDRVKELRRVPASELRANPKNWRKHPPNQEAALRDMMEKIGIADALIARETDDGLELIDGHLRQEVVGDQEVPVLILDVSEEEADTILLTLDPLTMMGKTDKDALDSLLARVDTESEQMSSMLATLGMFETEAVDLSDLHPHPRNYKKHPQDQLEHLAQSIREHGLYRNVVIARDNTILAGHGVVEAAHLVGLSTIPVVRLDIEADDPQALKLLAADNEISHLGENNDRALTELLKEIYTTSPTGLLGTGYNEQMLASLTMVTRPQNEIGTFDAAAEWLGMPEFLNESEVRTKYILQIWSETPESRLELIEYIQKFEPHFSSIPRVDKPLHSAWWPPRQNDDISSIRFESDAQP